MTRTVFPFPSSLLYGHKYSTVQYIVAANPMATTIYDTYVPPPSPSAIFFLTFISCKAEPNIGRYVRRKVFFSSTSCLENQKRIKKEGKKKIFQGSRRYRV